MRRGQSTGASATVVLALLVLALAPAGAPARGTSEGSELGRLWQEYPLDDRSPALDAGPAPRPRPASVDEGDDGQVPLLALAGVLFLLGGALVVRGFVTARPSPSPYY